MASSGKQRDFTRRDALVSIAGLAGTSLLGCSTSPGAPDGGAPDGGPSDSGEADSEGGASSGFYSDPYSGLETWYVDGAAGVDTSNPGVDKRSPGYVYKTYANALVDVFFPGNGGARRIVVRAGVYSPPATGGYFPAGGPDAAHPCVIQGDPTLASPPVIDGGSQTGRAAFGIGNLGSFGTGPVTVNNVVIRKLEIRNFNGDSIYFYNGPSSNVTIEYCNFHGNRYPTSTPSSAGAVAITTANCTSALTIRYCKFSDFRTVSSGWSLNCVPIETYGSDDVIIQNCLFQGVYAAIRTKLLDGVGTANRWAIRNNIFENNYAGFMEGTNGNHFLGHNDWAISGNLFYGPPLNVGAATSADAWASQGFASTQGSNISFTNNTIAEDIVAGFGWIGASGVVVLDNVMLEGRHIWTPNTGDPAVGQPSAITFKAFDHNAYGPSSTWGLGWSPGPYAFKYEYTTFAEWQAAYTVPLAPGGGPASPAPPDLASLPGSHNPDAAGVSIPSLAAPFNTLQDNFPNAAARNYAIAAGSPLLTASSTGGPVGYDPTNVGGSGLRRTGSMMSKDVKGCRCWVDPQTNERCHDLLAHGLHRSLSECAGSSQPSSWVGLPDPLAHVGRLRGAAPPSSIARRLAIST